MLPAKPPAKPSAKLAVKLSAQPSAKLSAQPSAKPSALLRSGTWIISKSPMTKEGVDMDITSI